MKAALPLTLALVLAGPAFAQDDRVWALTETDESVHLQYGTPESDDVLATFACQKGSDRAELYLTFEHRIAAENPTSDGDWVDAQGRKQPWPVELVLNGVRRQGEGFADEMNGGTTVSYADDTTGFFVTAALGKVEAQAFGETLSTPSFRKADIRRFLIACQEG